MSYVPINVFMGFFNVKKKRKEKKGIQTFTQTSQYFM